MLSIPLAGLFPEAPLTDLLKAARLQQLRSVTAAPDFAVQDLAGKQVKLSDFRGKVVFLNFWATWCPPCRAEMPSMQRVYEKYKDKIAFMAVDMQEKKDKVAPFVQKEGYTFPIYLDERGAAAMMYGIQSIPTTFIVDKQGNIAAAAIGAREWDTPAVYAVIDALVGGI
jgi:thiol-disulfide isomerase/thioredoxin